MQRNVWLLLLIFLVSCASGGKIKVTTNPEGANVFIKVGPNSPMKIGVTPAVIEQNSVPSLFTESVSIIVDKEGYLPESILIPKTQFPWHGDLSIVMKKPLLPLNCQDQEEVTKELAFNLARGHGLLMKRNMDEAEAVLTNLASKFPHISVVYDLLGNLNYLKKDLSKALLYYKRSHELQPNNQETTKLVEKLSRIKVVP